MKKNLLITGFIIFLSAATQAQVLLGVARIATSAAVSKGLNKSTYDLSNQTTSELTINGETVTCRRTPQSELDKMKNQKEIEKVGAAYMETIESELEKCKVALENKQVLEQVPDLESTLVTLKKTLPGVNVKSYRKELEFYKRMEGKAIQ